MTVQPNPDEQLITGARGRWLGPRGIFCHRVPDVEDIDPKDWDGALAHHTMVTVVADWAPGTRGELIRWVDAEEVSYEARINGLEDHAGICDASAFSLESLAALEKIAGDLRYMWEVAIDPDTRGAWSTWSTP
jgi:hypothetical protein